MEASTITNTSSVDNPDGTFRGTPYFNCSNETFTRCMQGKEKYKKWNAYLKDEDLLGKVKVWQGQSYKNKQSNFIIRNQDTREMVYARNG